jgi:hypothetical protein
LAIAPCGVSIISAPLLSSESAAYLPIPKTTVGQEILLDGEIVVGLLTPVLASALKLLAAVDAWIPAN